MIFFQRVPLYLSYVQRFSDSRASIRGLSLNNSCQFVKVLFDCLQDRCRLQMERKKKKGSDFSDAIDCIRRQSWPTFDLAVSIHEPHQELPPPPAAASAPPPPECEGLLCFDDNFSPAAPLFSSVDIPGTRSSLTLERCYGRLIASQRLEGD